MRADRLVPLVEAASHRGRRSSFDAMAVEIRQPRPGEEGRLVQMYDWLFEPPGSRPSQWDAERARERLGEAIALSGERSWSPRTWERLSASAPRISISTRSVS